MIMFKRIECCQVFMAKYPDSCIENCYEAIANGRGSKTEIHGFVINDLYFIDSETMEVYSKDYFILVENIEDALQD